MTTIDDKVVSASFESSKFEAGVGKTLSALDKLKAALKFENAGKGLESIDAAAHKIDLGHIGRGIEEVTTKLGALNVAAVAIFANIAMKAVAAGAQFAKSFTIQPIVQGYQEYATNLNAIQTILANTQASGATLDDVNAALQDLNTYSDKTIYNFSQMAKNIGTFTAAGVDLDTATGAIKGIANLAALSGSNADQASTAMYQLSQAISAGRVGLQDWNSVVNAGMGGTVFQRALAQTAVAMGELKDNSLKLVGPMKNVSINGESFRQSMQAGPGKQPWLTSKVLTTTLKQFTGDLSDAQVKAMGFNDAQIKAIQQTAKTAMHAATEVKTLTQVFDVAKETAGSGWAKTFQIIFGNFGEAKKTFTALSNTINGFINTNADARNKVLADWKKLGGRAILIDNIKQAFHNLGLILRPIKKAFRDIFPATTGRDLINLTVKFAKFAQALAPTPTTMQNLRRTFRGFFAVLDIGKQIVGGIFTVLGQLFHTAGGGSGSFLKLTATIGDFLVSLDKSLKKGDRLHKFFVGLGNVLAVPLQLLAAIAGAIGDLFSGFSPGGFSDQVDTATKAMTPFEKILHAVAEAWDKFLDGFSGADTILRPVFDAIANMFQQLGPNISDAIRNMNVEAILQVVRTGLFASLVLLIRNFLGTGSFAKQLGGIGGGFLKNLSTGFSGLTGSMKAMQRSLQAKTLKDIAIAIALLTASVVALSFVDPEKLKASLAAITVMFGELLAAMGIMDKISSSRGAAKMPFITASLLLLAGAIDLLAIAVFTLSRLSWEELAKGLGAVGALLGGIAVASGPLSKASPRLVLAGAGIGAIGAGLNVLALAVRNFGSMDTKQLKQGLIGVGIALGAIALASEGMPATMPLIGAGLIAVAIGLRIMVSAVAAFGALDWKVIHKGLVGIGASLFIIAAAMQLMPVTMPLTAAGLLLVSLALGKIAKAVASMGNLSVKQIAKGLIALGLALDILATGMYAMSGSLAGAIALGVAALAISVLVPALESLGKQSWKQIIKSIVALGIAFGVLALAGLALQPVTPALLGLGAAMLLIGGGFALLGAGIFLIGAGLSAIAIAGSSAAAILIQAVVDFTEAIPKMLTNLVIGLLAMVRALAKTAPKFVDAIVTILETLLDAVIKIIPKLVVVIETLVAAIIKLLGDKQDNLIQAGIDLILALLRGIGRNIKAILKAASQIVIQFIKGIADHISDLIAAGADIIVHLVSGLGSVANKLITAGVNTLISFITGLGQNTVRLANAAGQVILNFIKGLTKAVDKYEPQIIRASIGLGKAIVAGMVKGLVGDKVWNKAKEIAKKAWDFISHPWRWHSPSKTMVELGQAIVDGFALGLGDHKAATSAAAQMSNNVIDTFNTTFQTASPSKVMYRIGKYVGKGFANGLSGSAADVSAAFEILNGKISDAISSVKKTIEKEQGKLATLLKGKDLADPAAVAHVQSLIDANKALLATLTSSHVLLTKAMHDQRIELTQWGRRYDELTDKIVAAKQVLVDAKKTRDDFAAQVASQYGELPSIDTESADQLTNYEDALADRITAIKAYKTTLDKLRNLGLDDKTYQKLLSEGTVDQKFADQLLEGGRSAVQELNKLDSDLDSTSKALGKTSASNLYQMGVDTAQGLIDGLRAQRENIMKIMEFIAEDMVTTIKKKLKIKSPSEVFGEIGGYASAGIAKGLLDSSKLVTGAVYSVADDAAKAMGDSLSKISDAIANEVDPNPTITPILDLSNIQNGARTLGSMLDPDAIRPAYSATQASAISSAGIARTLDTSETVAGGASLTFEQNNYSPEALSPVEIYRQTRNGLSRFKAILAPEPI